MRVGHVMSRVIHHLISEFSHLYEGAVGADARLPGVAEGGGHDALCRQLHIGVVEHNEGRVAAQLQADLVAGDSPGQCPTQRMAPAGICMADCMPAVGYLLVRTPSNDGSTGTLIRADGWMHGAVKAAVQLSGAPF